MVSSGQAYESKGHCVVLAGPGSGKTKVLTVKLARLIAEEDRPAPWCRLPDLQQRVRQGTDRRLARLGIRNSRNVFVGHGAFVLPEGRRPALRQHGRVWISPTRCELPCPPIRSGCSVRRRISRGRQRAPENGGRRCDRYRRTLSGPGGTGMEGQDSQTAEVIEEYERRLRDGRVHRLRRHGLLGLRLIEAHPWVRKAADGPLPGPRRGRIPRPRPTLHRLVMSLCFGRQTLPPVRRGRP